MPFYEIEFPLTGLDTEAVETALLECGAISITFSIAAMNRCSNPTRRDTLWSDTLVRALFDAGAAGRAAAPMSRLKTRCAIWRA
jgi:hypothetical protein